MAVALICTVGMTMNAQTDIVDALAREVKSLEPTHTAFVATAESRANAERIAQLAGLTNGAYEIVELSSSHNLDETFENVNALIRGLHERGYSGDQICINYTGGTKVMSSGAVLAAVFNQCRELRYLYEGRPEDQQLVRTQPQSVFAYRDILLAQRLIREMRFQSARDLLSRLDVSYLSQHDREVADALRRLAIAYARWDNFHYRACLEQMTDTAHGSPLLKPLLITQEMCSKLSALADELEKNEYSPLVFAEMYNNAVRRRLEGKLDDAVARIYRALEMLAQWVLKRYEINTNDLDTRKVPPRYRVHFEAMRSMDDGLVRIGMRKAYELLVLLETPLGKQFTSDAELAEMLHTRSHSILAHGTRSISEAECDKLLGVARKMFQLEIPDFDQICAELQFPWL